MENKKEIKKENKYFLGLTYSVSRGKHFFSSSVKPYVRPTLRMRHDLVEHGHSTAVQKSPH